MSIRNTSSFTHYGRVASLGTAPQWFCVRRAMSVAKRRREQVLASLAFIMLIVAWDATLRLDERMSPPRMRMSHAVEREVGTQVEVFVP